MITDKQLKDIISHGAIADVFELNLPNKIRILRKFYYKRTSDGDTETWQISIISSEGFILHPAFDRPDGERDYISYCDDPNISHEVFNYLIGYKYKHIIDKWLGFNPENIIYSSGNISVYDGQNHLNRDRATFKRGNADYFNKQNSPMELPYNFVKELLKDIGEEYYSVRYYAISVVPKEMNSIPIKIIDVSSSPTLSNELCKYLNNLFIMMNFNWVECDKYGKMLKGDFGKCWQELNFYAGVQH